MWATLVLACVSSLSLSGRPVASQDPGASALNLTGDSVVPKSTPREAAESAPTPPPSSVPSAGGALGVTAGRIHRTDVGTPATAAGGPDLPASRQPTPPSPTSPQPAPSSTAALSIPHTQAPSNGTSPRAAPLVPLTSSTQVAAASSAKAGSPPGIQDPAERTSSPSTASPPPPVDPHTPNSVIGGSAIQVLTAQPVADTASGPTPSLTNATAASTLSSVASASTTAVTATKTQAEESAASTVPASVLPTSWTPVVEPVSPTTPPSPSPAPQGTPGLGTPPTPEQVQPEAVSGTAATSLTPGSSGDPKVPTTDSCQLSTQGQYLVVTTNPLPLSPVNRSALLAVLLLGVTLFVTVLVLFALQAYESYKKKGYTQVDYLINGMYADSEM
ncbi:uncharacterized protein C11orf24 homolog [Artibeus jamaicensis]|uniref:uncharacterized protein C11orf24 homolog n=1 Tax=Artibeus jamaicensis TaxID=9417 RepID=UPI00235AD015|nr:uncharacterized protein C11orf24 homolog [Artibeus jamaicensis]XP_036991248.2 uncharacterized protein C11orf24 homolog [Artibeus jamaicensis]XP_036991249.2 uncharacterized protein C11orf24 homolog [Artibeus jamaicensis]XP_036991250.2 uncharacterized protein C11orf24 homolog [Artibeus jamaicensis]